VLQGRDDSVGTAFGGNHPLKIWEDKKHSKFGAISDLFWLWSRISLERSQLPKKWNSKWSTTASLVEWKKLEKLCPLTKKFCCFILTYPKSTMCSISGNFIFWPPVSLLPIEISKIRIAHDQLLSLPFWVTKNSVNFGLITKKFLCLISTYLKSTLCVLCMLMHLSSSHVTLLLEEF